MRIPRRDLNGSTGLAEGIWRDVQELSQAETLEAECTFQDPRQETDPGDVNWASISIETEVQTFALAPSCEDPTGGNCDTVDYIDSTHDAAAAFGSEAGLARLFTDNFDGQGRRAYDFGMRRTDGDNPYPGQ